jgi:hypothetical protein
VYWARAFFTVEENIFVTETRQAARGVQNFYIAGVVTHGRL